MIHPYREHSPPLPETPTMVRLSTVESKYKTVDFYILIWLSTGLTKLGDRVLARKEQSNFFRRKSQSASTNCYMLHAAKQFSRLRGAMGLRLMQAITGSSQVNPKVCGVHWIYKQVKPQQYSLLHTKNRTWYRALTWNCSRVLGHLLWYPLDGLVS